MTQVDVAKVAGLAVLAPTQDEVHVAKVAAFVVENVYLGRIGDTVGYDFDEWIFGPTSFSHQWNRNGAPIDGATNPTYTFVEADAGAFITKTLWAHNAAGTSEPVTSEPIGPIREALS